MCNLVRCLKVNWKTAGLMKNAEIEFGRMYRQPINDKSVNIQLNTFEEISKNILKKQVLKMLGKMILYF